MRVRDVMKSRPATCRPQDTLAQAGRLMSRIGCGALPVIGEGGDLRGILTDRDVCGSLSRASGSPAKLTVAEAMTREVFACSVEDEIETALEMMKQHRVRRLPVVDGARNVLAMLSLDDIAVAAHASADAVSDITWAQVGEALKAISQHPVPALAG